MTSNENAIFRVINSRTYRNIKLGLQELWLTGRILPVGAALQLRHIFTSGETGPIELVYAFGLPRDAALRSFRIVGEGFSISSELKSAVEAGNLYEKGIESGHLASLVGHYRDGVVNLNLGNIRPGETVAVCLDILAGVELRDDGLRFRFPFTLAPTYHPSKLTIVSKPGIGEMELPKDFGDVMLPKWIEDPRGLHKVGFELELDVPQGVAEVGSPSHSIKIQSQSDLRHIVSLARDGDVPDRDLILDIRTRKSEVGVTGGISAEGRGYFAMVVPSSAFGAAEVDRSRVVFVIDRSGSMQGTPIMQARKSIEACLGALSESDQFGIVAFDDRIDVLSDKLMDGSRKSRDAAQKFLETVDSRGGTELVNGITAAAKILGREGGDILILTDGQVSGTDAITAQARATGIRIHCLGIGSASQDRFLALLARETGGVSRFVTVQERVDLTAVELFASIGHPVARDIKVADSGVGISPQPPSTIFAGTPLILFGESDGRGEKSVHLNWQGPNGAQELTLPLKLTDSPDADLVRLLQGARLITDMEAQAGGDADTSREKDRRMKRLEKLSTRYGLASQAMSLVAVVERQEDNGDLIPKTMIVPVGMPRDTSFAASFRSFRDPLAMYADTLIGSSLGFSHTIEGRGTSSTIKDRLSRNKQSAAGEIFDRVDGKTGFGMFSDIKPKVQPHLEDANVLNSTDILVQLAGCFEPDGGMPGKNEEDRWIATATALVCFISEGHTIKSGAFRIHVRKMLAFLKNATATTIDNQKRRFVELIESGAPLPEELTQDYLDRAGTLIRAGRIDPWPRWKEMNL